MFWSISRNVMRHGTEPNRTEHSNWISYNTIFRNGRNEWMKYVHFNPNQTFHTLFFLFFAVNDHFFRLNFFNFFPILFKLKKKKKMIKENAKATQSLNQPSLTSILSKKWKENFFFFTFNQIFKSPKKKDLNMRAHFSTVKKSSSSN